SMCSASVHFVSSPNVSKRNVCLPCATSAALSVESLTPQPLRSAAAAPTAPAKARKRVGISCLIGSSSGCSLIWNCVHWRSTQSAAFPRKKRFRARGTCPPRAASNRGRRRWSSRRRATSEQLVLLHRVEDDGYVLSRCVRAALHALCVRRPGPRGPDELPA